MTMMKMISKLPGLAPQATVTSISSVPAVYSKRYESLTVITTLLSRTLPVKALYKGHNSMHFTLNLVEHVTIWRPLPAWLTPWVRLTLTLVTCVYPDAKPCKFSIYIEDQDVCRMLRSLIVCKLCILSITS